MMLASECAVFRNVQPRSEGGLEITDQRMQRDIPAADVY